MDIKEMKTWAVIIGVLVGGTFLANLLNGEPAGKDIVKERKVLSEKEKKERDHEINRVLAFVLVAGVAIAIVYAIKSKKDQTNSTPPVTIPKTAGWPPPPQPKVLHIPPPATVAVDPRTDSVAATTPSVDSMEGKSDVTNSHGNGADHT
jgi:hypothetical protein